MNMQNLMAQAQKVQRELEKANTEIENTDFEGNSGAIKVIITGKNKLKSVDITDDAILTDKEMLQDMLLVALNDAFSKVNKMKEQKLGKYTGGLGGLF